MKRKARAPRPPVSLNAQGDLSVGGDVVGGDKTTVNHYYLGLDFLWKFLQPLFDGSARDRLPPAPPPDAARQRAFRLYETLDALGRKTETFVDALDGTVQQVRRSAPQPTVESRLRKLRTAARELTDALPELATAIEGVFPQLDIHRHELFQNLRLYTVSRAAVLADLESGLGYTRLEETAAGAVRMPLADLERILAAAEKNRHLIRNATTELRSFLAQQFPFKESF